MEIRKIYSITISSILWKKETYSILLRAICNIYFSINNLIMNLN